MEEVMNKLDMIFNVLTEKIDGVEQKVDRLEQQIQNVKTDLEQQIQDVRQDLEQQIQDVKKDLESQIQNVKSDLENQIQNVRDDLFVVEMEHGKKIDVLFDAFVSEREKNQEKIERLINLHMRADKTDLQILNHETRICNLGSTRSNPC